MGFIFAVKAAPAPGYRAVVSGLGLDDVRPFPDEDYHPADGGPWADGVYHFFRPYDSTRGVEVSVEADKGEFWVRVNTLGSPADYDLALRFAGRVAELTGRPVETSDDRTTPADRLREVFDPEWVANEIVLEAGVVSRLLSDPAQGYEFLTLGGCVRPFHIGPRVLAGLTAAGHPDGLPDRMVEAMRDVQWVDEDDYYPADVLRLKKTGEDEFTLSIFGPETAYLFGNVDRLLVIGGEGEDGYMVPYPALGELLPGGWEWLDERQMLVEPVPAADWPAVRERAERLAVAVHRFPRG